MSCFNNKAIIVGPEYSREGNKLMKKSPNMLMVLSNFKNNCEIFSDYVAFCENVSLHSFRNSFSEWAVGVKG